MRGVALVQALVIVAALAALALALSQRSEGAIRRLEARFAADQRALYLDAGTDLLRETLPEGMVHGGQDWARPRDDVVIGDAVLSWRVEDLQGRFNLGWLPLRADAPATLERLLEGAGIAAPERAAFLAMLAESDLPDWGRPEALLAALPAATRQALRPAMPLLALLPGERSANLNTLKPEVLAALAPGLTQGQRQGVLALVAERPATAIEEVLPRIAEVLGEEVRATLAALPLGVTSGSFEIRIEARLDSQTLRRSGVVDTEDPNREPGQPAPLRLGVPLFE